MWPAWGPAAASSWAFGVGNLPQEVEHLDDLDVVRAALAGGLDREAPQAIGQPVDLVQRVRLLFGDQAGHVDVGKRFSSGVCLNR